MGLAAICIAFPPYPFQPIQMTLINFFCIGYPGFVLGLEANRARVEGNFLTNVVKRALPAALGVLVGACLNMALCSFAELSVATLSTMCLVTTSAVGCCLIARISWPFTPLRIALFISIVVGLAVGILGFADFFSIARLSLGMAVELVVVSLLSCALFFALARAMDRLQPRRTHSASGFGRGVQVKMGRSGMRSVRSTRSALRRFWWRSRDRFNRYVTEHRHEDAAAADHAFRAEGSAPKLPFGRGCAPSFSSRRAGGWRRGGGREARAHDFERCFGPWGTGGRRGILRAAQDGEAHQVGLLVGHQVISRHPHHYAGA